MFDVQRLICQKYLSCQDLQNLEESNCGFLMDESIWQFKRYLKLKNQKAEDSIAFYFNRCKKLKYLEILSVQDFDNFIKSLKFFGLNESLEKIVITELNELSVKPAATTTTTICDFKVLRHFEILNIRDDNCKEVLNFLNLNAENKNDANNLETLILNADYVTRKLYFNDEYKGLKRLEILGFCDFFISDSVYSNLEILSVEMQHDTSICNLNNFLSSSSSSSSSLKKLTLKFFKYYCVYLHMIYMNFDLLEFFKNIIERNENLKHLTLIDYYSKKQFYEKNLNLSKFFDKIKHFVRIDLKFTGLLMKDVCLNLYKDYVTTSVDENIYFLNFSNLRELYLYKVFEDNVDDNIKIIKAINVVKKSLKKFYILNVCSSSSESNYNHYWDLFVRYLDRDNNIETLQLSRPFYDFKILSRIFPNLKFYKQFGRLSCSFEFPKLMPAIEANKNVCLENCRKFKVIGRCFEFKRCCATFFVDFYVKHYENV